MSLKVAVSGKGGVGKTTLVSMLAYMFSKRGKSVISIDGDPDMNLHNTLGIKEIPPPISELREVIEERVNLGRGMFRLNPRVDDILKDYSAINEEGIRLVVLGTIEKGGEGCFCPASAFLKAVLRQAIFRENDLVLLDLDAGIEHLGRGTAKGVDLLIVVVEPGARSLDTLIRISKLSSDIGISRIGVVVNKYVETDRMKTLLENIEFPVLGVIPFDRCFMEADMANIPPYRMECVPMKPFEDILMNVIDIVGE
jgi:CO dehydrogenase maturation factor